MTPETTNAVAQHKGYKGIGMEGFIASWYARQTAKDMDRFKDTARRAAAYVGPRSCVLEIAPGPGYLAVELAKLTGCRMVGENARKAGIDIAFEQGDAADLPLPADGFDFIVCTAAFKNFTRPLAALDEIYRVLKPGGTALIIDLRKDFSPQAIRDYVSDKGLINGTIIRWTFNAVLKKRAYTTERIKQLVAQSQFRGGDVRLDAIAFELWLRKPEQSGR
jgi:ubiquinone/menaquinone biosynthesis C-methylase UbiE